MVWQWRSSHNEEITNFPDGSETCHHGFASVKIAQTFGEQLLYIIYIVSCISIIYVVLLTLIMTLAPNTADVHKRTCSTGLPEKLSKGNSGTEETVLILCLALQFHVLFKIVPMAVSA